VPGSLIVAVVAINAISATARAWSDGEPEAGSSGLAATTGPLDPRQDDRFNQAYCNC